MCERERERERDRQRERERERENVSMTSTGVVVYRKRVGAGAFPLHDLSLVGVDMWLFEARFRSRVAEHTACFSKDEVTFFTQVWKVYVPEACRKDSNVT